MAENTIACAWCNITAPQQKPVQQFKKVELSNTKMILCDDCIRCYKHKICRVCKQPIGTNSVNGVCIICMQLGNFEAEAAEIEKELSGETDEELVQVIASKQSRITEDDFASMLLFGHDAKSAERIANYKATLAAGKGSPGGANVASVTPPPPPPPTPEQLRDKRIEADGSLTAAEIKSCIADINSILPSADAIKTYLTNLNQRIVKLTDMGKYIGYSVKQVAGTLALVEKA